MCVIFALTVGKWVVNTDFEFNTGSKAGALSWLLKLWVYDILLYEPKSWLSFLLVVTFDHLLSIYDLLRIPSIFSTSFLFISFSVFDVMTFTFVWTFCTSISSLSYWLTDDICSYILIFCWFLGKLLLIKVFWITFLSVFYIVLIYPLSFFELSI